MNRAERLPSIARALAAVLPAEELPPIARRLVVYFPRDPEAWRFAAELGGAVLAARPGAATGPTGWDEADPRTEDDRLDLAAPRLGPPLHNRPAP